MSGFSPKQKRVLSWWMPGSGDREYEAILCDGAVRSGKTLAMSLGFFLWAMTCFSGESFCLGGRTQGSLRRNVLSQVLPRLAAMGMACKECRGDNLLEVGWGGRMNRFYLFGGQDARSASVIQGMTLAGVLLDEAALMHQSFVEQACARCSVPGSRLWFNCNPEGPGHWFYREWVLGAEEKNCLRLHFTMEDNPGLTEKIRRRYERLYSGVFYQRYVQGLWVQAEGRVYDFFTGKMVGKPPADCDKWYISCDYGTVNPMSMGLWGRCAGTWYRVKEFYFDSREEKRQMTDGEYAEALEDLAGGRPITAVIVDPSAASFLELLRRRGWRVKKGVNEVLSGIRRTADCLKSGQIVIGPECRNCLREMDAYIWDTREGNRDRVRKEHDHAMDDMRYFVSTVLREEPGEPEAWAVERKTQFI